MVMQLCVEIIGDRLNPEDESQEELAELTTAGSRAGSLVRQLWPSAAGSYSGPG